MTSALFRTTSGVAAAATAAALLTSLGGAPALAGPGPRPGVVTEVRYPCGTYTNLNKVNTDGDAYTDGYETHPRRARVLDPARRDVDTDSDDLPDGYEQRLGTRPGVADTDGDGMPDGLEALDVAAHADPLRADTDTDGDRLPDAFERSLGSSSTDTDTDGDGIGDNAEALEYHRFRSATVAETDTDGDMVPDAVETRRSLRVGDTDTDDDGFGDGVELVRGRNPQHAEGDRDRDGVSNDCEQPPVWVRARAEAVGGTVPAMRLVAGARPVVGQLYVRGQNINSPWASAQVLGRARGALHVQVEDNYSIRIWREGRAPLHELPNVIRVGYRVWDQDYLCHEYDDTGVLTVRLDGKAAELKARADYMRLSHAQLKALWKGRRGPFIRAVRRNDRALGTVPGSVRVQLLRLERRINPVFGTVQARYRLQARRRLANGRTEPIVSKPVYVTITPR